MHRIHAIVFSADKIKISAGLSKKRRSRQKQRAGGRIHERKILRVRVKLVAAQHGLPCIKPGPVIHLRAAVQKANKRQKSEGYRRGDETAPG